MPPLRRNLGERTCLSIGHSRLSLRLRHQMLWIWRDKMECYGPIGCKHIAALKARIEANGLSASPCSLFANYGFHYPRTLHSPVVILGRRNYSRIINAGMGERLQCPSVESHPAPSTRYPRTLQSPVVVPATNDPSFPNRCDALSCVIPPLAICRLPAVGSFPHLYKCGNEVWYNPGHENRTQADIVEDSTGVGEPRPTKPHAPCVDLEWREGRG